MALHGLLAQAAASNHCEGVSSKKYLELKSLVSAFGLIKVLQLLAQARDQHPNRCICLGVEIGAAAQRLSGNGVFIEIPVAILPQVKEELSQQSGSGKRTAIEYSGDVIRQQSVFVLAGCNVW